MNIQTDVRPYSGLTTNYDNINEYEIYKELI